jgi:hypothetical protein
MSALICDLERSISQAITDSNEFVDIHRSMVPSAMRLGRRCVVQLEASPKDDSSDFQVDSRPDRLSRVFHDAGQSGMAFRKCRAGQLLVISGLVLGTCLRPNVLQPFVYAFSPNPYWQSSDAWLRH